MIANITTIIYVLSLNIKFFLNFKNLLITTLITNKSVFLKKIKLKFCIYFYCSNFRLMHNQQK